MADLRCVLPLETGAIPDGTSGDDHLLVVFNYGYPEPHLYEWDGQRWYEEEFGPLEIQLDEDGDVRRILGWCWVVRAS